MKTLLISLLILLGISSHGQALRNLNGSGTNTTIYNGLTLTNTGGTATITNIGPMVIRVGAGILGTQFTITDTNGTGRIQLQGHNILLNDTNGNTILQINTDGALLTSGSADSGTSVALQQTTSSYWDDSGAMLATFKNAGTNNMTVSHNGGITVGKKTVDWFGGPAQNGETIISMRDMSFGEANLNEIFAGVQHSASSVYGYFDAVANTNSASIEIKTDTGADIARIIGEVTGGSAKLRFVSGGGVKTTLEPTVANGATAVAYNFDTANTLSTAGAKLLSLKNATAEKAYIDKDGGLVISGVYTGNGAGLTNLTGATNFTDTVVYNFNGKVTFNAVSYNTNLWAGPTNTLLLSTNYQDYITTTDVNITNIGGQLARQNTWATLTISNASAADITVRTTASGVRPQGSGTSAAMVVGAGKEGILSFLSRDFKSTNYVTTAQQ